MNDQTSHACRCMVMWLPVIDKPVGPVHRHRARKKVLACHATAIPCLCLVFGPPLRCNYRTIQCNIGRVRTLMVSIPSLRQKPQTRQALAAVPKAKSAKSPGRRSLVMLACQSSSDGSGSAAACTQSTMPMAKPAHTTKQTCVAELTLSIVMSAVASSSLRLSETSSSALCITSAV